MAGNGWSGNRVTCYRNSVMSFLCYLTTRSLRPISEMTGNGWPGNRVTCYHNSVMSFLCDPSVKSKTYQLESSFEDVEPQGNCVLGTRKHAIIVFLVSQSCLSPSGTKKKTKTRKKKKTTTTKKQTKQKRSAAAARPLHALRVRCTCV